MPIYESQCLKCGKTHDYVRTVAQYLDTPECCDAKTEKRIFTVPMGYVQPDVCYDSPIDGRPITSKQARIEDMKRSNSRPWEGMVQENKEAQRRAAYEDQASDLKLEKATETALMQISEDSRRVLIES